VYAVTTCILSAAKIVPTVTVLDAKPLPEAKMPNRDGFIPDLRPENFPPAANTHQSLMIVTPPI
jgi:cytochrome c